MRTRPIPAVAAAALVLTALVAGPPASARQPGAATASSCEDRPVVVADSRHTLESLVLPRTTDAVWAALFGSRGVTQADGTTAHVRYVARPGTVHEDLGAELDAAMASCGSGDRPLILDLMGTNDAVAHPERVGDPTFAPELAAGIEAFYAVHAPTARIVLGALTLNPEGGPGVPPEAAARYVADYDAALADLAHRRPDRFFYLPAPAVYRDGTIRWQDAAHETFAAPLEALVARDSTLDDAAMARIAGADGDVCAVLASPDFSPERYSEGISLMAYLQDLRRSERARRWFARTGRPVGRSLAPEVQRCGLSGDGAAVDQRDSDGERDRDDRRDRDGERDRDDRRGRERHAG